MYELFILGKLMHRPMHPYLLQAIINAALGPFRHMSWGTLYPLIRKLEQAGLIVVQGGVSKDRRGTKTYRTTPAGRARFLELMRKTGDHDTDYRDVFRVKLSGFGHLGEKDQLLILEDHRATLANIAMHSAAMADHVAKDGDLAPAEKPYVLKAIDHQQRLAECEIAWVDSLLDQQHRSGKRRKRSTE
jgi:DNA-binding PadR family transcriptional regulator